jgi:hypothetical protein
VTEQDQPDFAHLMAMLDKAFRQETSDLGNEVYWQGLRDCEIEDVKAAFVQAIRELKFYPKVSELRDLIRGKPDDVAALALRRVNEAVVEPGTYESVTFDDPVIHWVLETMGGWPVWGEIKGDEAAFREQDFRRLYEIGLKRGIGWADTHRVLKGRRALQDAVAGLADTHAPKMIECGYLTAQRRAEIEAGRQQKAIAGSCDSRRGQT